MKMRFHSHGNEFNLHVNEMSFSYERMGTKTRFEKEVKGNSKMAYLRAWSRAFARILASMSGICNQPQVCTQVQLPTAFAPRSG